jgi:hypothetical protein
MIITNSKKQLPTWLIALFLITTSVYAAESEVETQSSKAPLTEHQQEQPKAKPIELPQPTTLSVADKARAEANKLSDKEVRFGLFITNIFDINFTHNEFQVEFWSWFLTKRQDYKPVERTEIVQAKSFQIRNSSTENIDGLFLHAQAFKAKIKQHWDIGMFPFDVQQLTISLEDTLQTKKDLEFSLDPSSSIAHDIIPDGWNLVDFKTQLSETYYPTTFGDPRITLSDQNTYHRIQAVITIQRDGGRLFATTFLGFFVASILVILILLVNTSTRCISAIPLQPRITLCIGSLFSAVGSTYGLAAKLPYTTRFTLADSIEMTTFTGIALAIISSVFCDIFRQKGYPEQVAKTMRWILISYFILHFGINGLLLFNIANV